MTDKEIQEERERIANEEVQAKLGMETKKIMLSIKPQAAIAVFQGLVQEYEKVEHYYNNADEYKADIKLMADKAWVYADVFIDSYNLKWKDKDIPIKSCPDGLTKK